MGTSSTAYIMTISNSIIGVSVLAMPFCYKQCGIVLSSLLLLLSNILSRSTCHFLLKSAIMSRRRNYELLAFHVFGTMGKTFVEISIIGFMMGTCIAFFVVMGDLGPAILSNIFTHIRIETLRPTVLMGIAIFIVLPLGLLRNVESLSAVSTATILFYLCLVLKMVAESSSNLLQGDWVNEVAYWNPNGLLQCLPIFSMALFCQSQLFDIFESTPNLSLDRMNKYIGSAVNMCTGMYMSVGVFGYIAYYKLNNLSGNVLLSFTPNASSEMFKFGFVLSVAVSFPLVIFPCRASIYSFLFKKGHSLHYESATHNPMVGGSIHHIPESRFRCITLFIIFVSLLTALMATNIELVLGLVGATIGVLICILLPSSIFVTLSGKNTTERLLAKVIFVVGLAIMVLGTYANLMASEEEQQVTPLPSMFIVQKDVDKGEIMKLAESVRDGNTFILQSVDSKIEKPNLPGSKSPEVNKVRQDFASKVNQDKDYELKKKKSVREKKAEKFNRLKEQNVDNGSDVIILGNKSEVNKTQLEPKVKSKEDLVNNEAIRKEEKEAQNEVSKVDVKNHEIEILEKLRKQEVEQKKIMEQQEAILKEVIKQNKQLEEIKAKDGAKGEAGKTSSVKSVKNYKGNELKAVNNIISEKIQELNQNIKEHNKDEIQLTNQIDKVKENILKEVTPQGNVNKTVDKHILDGGKSIGVDKFNKPIVGQLLSNLPEPKDNVNIPIASRSDPNANDSPRLGDNVNNIESPPNAPSKAPANANALNEEFIEVEKDLNFKKIANKNKEDTKALDSVPIALMLQPSSNPEPKPSSIDVIKTRDILETLQREKRDVRQEPANPIPPEYEVQSPDPFQALKESVKKDIKALEEEERKALLAQNDQGSKEKAMEEHNEESKQKTGSKEEAIEEHNEESKQETGIPRNSEASRYKAANASKDANVVDFGNGAGKNPVREKIVIDKGKVDISLNSNAVQISNKVIDVLDAKNSNELSHNLPIPPAQNIPNENNIPIDLTRNKSNALVEIVPNQIDENKVGLEDNPDPIPNGILLDLDHIDKISDIKHLNTNQNEKCDVKDKLPEPLSNSLSKMENAHSMTSELDQLNSILNAQVINSILDKTAKR